MSPDDKSGFFRTPAEIKALRVQIDACILEARKVGTAKAVEGPKDEEGMNLYGMAAYQVEAKLTEAKMWAGKMLEGLGTPFPPELADKAKV